MSAIQTDFDRIALLETGGWNHNNHYHDFLLRNVPPGCQKALEIGCGTGSFSRQLAGYAKQVLALDLSPEMIRIAQSRSDRFPNIEFRVVSINPRNFPSQGFDCIAAIATLHHLPLAEMLSRMKDALQPGGVLVVLDLFEPEGLSDTLRNSLAVPLSVGLRVLHDGRVLPPRELRDAFAEHARHDTYTTFSQVREMCADILPGARLKKHFFWRYSIVWRKE
ncbi:MAG: class I SAM-dependent methyltransferase [Pyrinomonadaceae bacterium]